MTSNSKNVPTDSYTNYNCSLQRPLSKAVCYKRLLKQLDKNAQIEKLYGSGKNEVQQTIKDEQSKSLESFFIDSSPIILNSNQNETKKSYAVTTDSIRSRFIQLWRSGKCTIKQSANETGINYSTAKSIVKLLRNEGRIEKKKKRLSKQIRHQKDELEKLLLEQNKSLKVQDQGYVVAPSLIPIFYQGLDYDPEIWKQKSLVQKASKSHLIDLTYDFFSFKSKLELLPLKKDLSQEGITAGFVQINEHEKQSNSLKNIKPLRILENHETPKGRQSLFNNIIQSTFHC